MSSNNATSSYGSIVDFKNEAQSAHLHGDVEASRHVHELKQQLQQSSEGHLTGGGYIKNAVYGGLDGIITTFATVTSVSGSGLSHSVILIIGLAHLVADGLSMGLGDCLSTQAEIDLNQFERRREVWEFENYPEGEIEEMIELYERKGISSADARLVIETLAKYKEAFIDIMMVEELNLMPVDPEENVLVGGLVTFGSFVAFGTVPLLSYLANLLPGMDFDPATVFIQSTVLTVLTLFLLGAVKGNYVGQKWYLSGLSMTINGTIAAACGWVIGYLLQLTGIQNI